MQAHRAGQQDPRGYAMLLEKVGAATVDPSLASHWLTEAANVWVLSLNDAHRAARALMIAIDRDPTQAAPAERLGELYREKGDIKALAALLERRAKALAPLGQRDPEIRGQIAAIHEELGRLWADAPLSNTTKAIENFRRALEYDASSQFAIYSIREAYKAAGQVRDAIPYYAMEQALVDDPERKMALYADEADARKSVGDISGALAALDRARGVDPNDPGLKQQLATLVLDEVREGHAVDENWKATGAELFVELAEEYPGEHGYAYSTCALEILAGHDRAIQLAIYYGQELGRTAEVAPFAASYVAANPSGALVEDARRVAGNSAPRAVPVTKAAPARAVEPRRAAERRPEQPPHERTIDDLEPMDEEGGEAGGDAISSLLDRAHQLASKNRKNEAAGLYRDVLKADPANADAIGYLQNFLRQGRRYGDLRDILLRASKSDDADQESKINWLREVAGLCENQLRDFETAIQAWQELIALDPGEQQGREQLRRLLERANRWDELAALIEQQAEQETDVEARIGLEKQLAKLHETRRKDPARAGEAWARIAALTPEDETAITTAVKLFEKGERFDLAAHVISENVGSVGDDASRAALYKRLGELRRLSGEIVPAADAFAEAAKITSEPSGWEAAEQAYVQAEAWGQAAMAVNERAALAQSPKQKAQLHATEADYLIKADDLAGAIARLDQAVEADPTDDDVAAALERHLIGSDRTGDVAGLLLRRAERHPDKNTRMALRKRAATIQRETLGEPGAARESLELVLKDGDDAEALSRLADDAEERAEFTEAVEYLARLGRASADNAQRAAVSLRQARLLADGAKDVDLAIEQYERVLSEFDPENQEALAAIADLEEKREKYDATARALERQLKLVTEPSQKIEIAGRLADLYETRLDEPKNALRALNVVFAADPDDFQAVQRIVEIAEKLEEWPTVAEHLARLVEVEGDEEEVSRMSLRLAEILSDQLDRGEDALNALGVIAEQGDAPCREAFVELGDRLGRKKLVASRLVEWFGQSPPSPERDKQLHGAFERFVEVGADEEAATVGKELARMRAAQRDIAVPLEEVSIRIKDLDALSVAHDLLVRELSGPARAEEMVRQAEVLIKAGVESLEAVQHGEQALTSIAPGEVEPLLDRLGKLLDGPAAVIDLYERQVGRCKSPTDRLAALGRAAQVAAERDAFERSRGFFDIAIGAGAQDDTLEALERIARATDESRDSKALRTTLAEAMAAGGQGSRDGGRTRGALLRRAAILAHRELGDRERAFGWLGDALVTHVDDPALDTLVELAREVGEPERAEIVLGRALSEVFDGPLVRKLLARRADLRAEALGDKRGAAEDLKRLHELAPADTDVMEKLSALYTDLEDYRGMVQLYEDQILRGRDQGQRAELARKVARLWEERLDDAREAADAWRRVLRMKAGDPEATAGLERAKSNMLKKPSLEDDDFVPLKAAPAPLQPAEPAPSDAVESPVDEPAEAGAASAEPETAAAPTEDAQAGETSSDHQPTTPPAGAVVAELARQTTPRMYGEDELTVDEPIPQALLDAARGSGAPAADPAAAPPAAAAADSDEVDVDVDVSAPTQAHPTPPPARTSHPPPPPSRRSSVPPPRSSPLASTPPGTRPPPPPSLRSSRPPPPPARAGGPPPLRSGPPPPPPSRAANKAPPPPKGKKGKAKKARDDNRAPKGSEDGEGSEEAVDDDELFD